MGAQDSPHMNEVGMQATKDSRPIHRVYVDGFWMDETDVTNDEFAKFVAAIGYVTVDDASIDVHSAVRFPFGKIELRGCRHFLAQRRFRLGGKN